MVLVLQEQLSHIFSWLSTWRERYQALVAYYESAIKSSGVQPSAVAAPEWSVLRDRHITPLLVKALSHDFVGAAKVIMSVTGPGSEDESNLSEHGEQAVDMLRAAGAIRPVLQVLFGVDGVRDDSECALAADVSRRVLRDDVVVVWGGNQLVRRSDAPRQSAIQLSKFASREVWFVDSSRIQTGQGCADLFLYFLPYGAPKSEDEAAAEISAAVRWIACVTSRSGSWSGDRQVVWLASTVGGEAWDRFAAAVQGATGRFLSPRRKLLVISSPQLTFPAL
mmetsp:Transcript_41206/g.93164  ORF Transcript_41206/g.93164 Transcript_41206/m.93164 type:complete len:279 (-) Transcript_41206:60-896(-)